MSEIQILLAGFGGQGVLFAGKIIAYAGLLEEREVSWRPSYGPEMRGGTANCSVTISDRAIGSPLVVVPNVLVAMNQPSYDKFVDTVEEGGLVLADTSLVPNMESNGRIRVAGIPASRLAEEEGLAGLMNVVLVGKLWAETQFCKRETLDAAIEKSVPPTKSALIEKNKHALMLGIGA